MTREQQLAVLRFYDEKFQKWEPEQCSRERNQTVGMGRGVKHARWMIIEMIRRIEADEEQSPGQADRWIGFVQAIFWTQGIYSIDDMAKLNTAPATSEEDTDEHPDPEAGGVLSPDE